MDLFNYIQEVSGLTLHATRIAAGNQSFKIDEKGCFTECAMTTAATINYTRNHYDVI